MARFVLEEDAPTTGGRYVMEEAPAPSTMRERQGQALPQTWADPAFGGRKAVLREDLGGYVLPDAAGGFNLVTRTPEGQIGFQPVQAGPDQQAVAREAAAGIPAGARGLMTALQGPTFGFLDELAGVPGGIRSAVAGEGFRPGYEQARDVYRAAVEQQRGEFPITSAVTAGMTAAPLVAAVPAALPRIATATLGQRMAAAAIPAAGLGALTGAGESTEQTPGGIAGDVALYALGSAALGGAMVPVAATVGAAGKRIAGAVSETKAAEFARQKVAEALGRDVRGRVAEAGGTTAAIEQAKARLGKLGPEAAVADVGGENTRRLLDTLATLPGKAKQAVEREIRVRQGGRGVLLAVEAEKALGASGRRYVDSIQGFDIARQEAARPYYDALRNVTVQADDEIAELLQRAAPYHGQTNKLAQTLGITPANLSRIRPGDSLPFATLDNLKQTLWDAGQEAKRQGKNKLGAAIDDLRVTLTSKMDDVSPQFQGQPLSKLARDAWAGPSQSMAAAEAGRAALREDAMTIADLTRGFSQSEMEAFRIGAAQSIRDKAGRQAGQTELLNFWKNPATSDKLREIFGGNYRAFSAALMRENVKKGLERVGRGSQTAERMAGMGDLDVAAVQDAAQVARNIFAPTPGGLMQAGLQGLARVQTPESVRNEMSRILLMKGPQAAQELNALQQIAEQVNRERMRRAAMGGAFTGLMLP